MDIELARTFLHIVRTGSFVAAAAKLHVTQTTVTARVQSLEAQLDCSLFIRNRAGARLTEEGERFVEYASRLVQTWDAARQDLPLPEGYGELLKLGGEVSLCNPLMLQWSTQLRRTLPSFAINIEVGEEPTLRAKLERGLLDAALVYRPEYWPGMQVEQIMEEKLIQVASTLTSEPYVYIDWGPDFRRQHDAALPDKARNVLSFNLGPLALQYILQCGGAGYFRSRVVKRYLSKGLMRRVDLAPEFSYPVFLVYPREKDSPELQQALTVLRTLVKEEADWSQHWESAPLEALSTL